MKIQASLKVMVKAKDIDSSYDYVNDAIKMIKNSGMDFFVSPSETTVEGDYDVIFELFKEIHEYLVLQGLPQITLIITTDYNAKNYYINEKLNNVKKNI